MSSQIILLWHVIWHHLTSNLTMQIYFYIMYILLWCFDMSCGFIQWPLWASYFALSRYFVVRLVLVTQPDFTVHTDSFGFILWHFLDVLVLVVDWPCLFFPIRWSVPREDRQRSSDWPCWCCWWWLLFMEWHFQQREQILVTSHWYHFETKNQIYKYQTDIWHSRKSLCVRVCVCVCMFRLLILYT